MLLNLNDGSTYEMPIIHDGAYDSGLSNFPNWDDEYWQFYEKNSATLQAYYLTSFLDALAGRDYFPNADSVYNICFNLRSDHEPEYYTEEGQQGKAYIDTILERIEWVFGSFDTGGVGLVRVGATEYTFIGFSGVYQNDYLENRYLYGFQTPAYTYEGNTYGVYTYTEISKGGFCMNTDITADSPPIWYCYDYAGFQYRYFIDYYQSVLTVDDRWEDGDFLAATNTSKYTWYDSIPFGFECPVRAWCPVTSFSKVEHKGLDLVAGDYWDINHTKLSGNIYGNSTVDMDDDPFGDAGFNDEAGGSGGFDGNNDDGGWTDDDQFAIDALNSGFLTLYNPTKSEVQAFNDFLFTDIDDTLATQLKHLIVSPLDYVVFLAMVHFKPNLKAAKQEIKFCGIGSEVNSNVVDKQMQKINCGTIFIDEVEQTASFLSYTPYTTIRAYLPYIGMVELSSDDIMGSQVNITYWVDLISGSCIAQVSCKRSKRRSGDVAVNNVVAEFTGNVFQDLPLSATDWRGLYQSVVSFSGGLVAAASGTAAGLGAVAASVMSQKESVARSGQLGSNYGYLGFQKPYLLIERPIVDMPQNVGKFQGWTAFFVDYLKNFEGYTEIQQNSLRIKNVQGITDEEIRMLEELLTNGVFLNWSGNEEV